MLTFEPAALEEIARTGFPPELTHLSASSLKTFMRCPETFRRRYMLDERIPPAAAMLWGRADHDTIEWNLKTKLETSYEQPVRDVAEYFAHRLDTEVEREGGLDGLEWKKGVGKRARKKEIGVAKDRGVRLVVAYREQATPALEPVAMEEPFTIDMAHAGVPVKVVGRIDLRAYRIDPFTRERLDKKPHTRERKTTGVKKGSPDQEWVFQSRIYQLHHREPVQIDLSVKNAKPVVVADDKAFRVRPWPAYKTEQMISQLCGQIGYLYVKHGPLEAWPGAWTHPWACGYCGYKRTCPWWI